MNARRAALALALAGLAAAAALYAAEPGFSSSARVDWEAGILAVEVSFALDPATDSLPRAKWDAEMEIEARKAAFLLQAISGVTVDSTRSFADLLAADPALFRSIEERALAAPRKALFLTPDLQKLVARYSVPFFGSMGLAAAIAHGEETPVRRSLGYAPSRAFQGILISAKGKLPVGGTSAESLLRPALFPRIFDTDMNLVLDRSMVSPEAIERGGVVGYVDSLDDSAVTLRAGVDPLRIAARAVFGRNTVDIIIPAEAARQILTVPENIELLRQGKVVIVYEKLD